MQQATRVERILAMLRAKPGMSAADLARALDEDAAHVADSLRDMRKRGVVVRRQGPKAWKYAAVDRRS